MISVKIDNCEFLVAKETSIIEACKYIGITLPRFCYHELLSVSGNCRMCLVEIENAEKPVAACVTETEDGMSIFTSSPFAKKARENVIETLLINHPLDCPICDQAGECDLQDQAKNFGSDYSRFYSTKRGVEDKNCGPLIKTIMTRCIHCTRCVRFGSEIAGIDYLGTLNRGSSTEIGSYITKFFNSEISGNVIDLCPVGALTSKPYAFKARPWELRLVSGIDLTDGLGSNIYINFKETEIVRILPRSNNEINNSIISDKARFSCDFLTENRIENLYKFDSLYKIINWKDFLVNISEFIEKNEKFLILIDEELDLENILLFKALEYKHGKKIKVKTINSLKVNSNLYENFLAAKIQSLNFAEFFILLGCNLKLEGTLLNAKIRNRFKNKLITVLGLGFFFKHNLPITFINLNILKLLDIFEGKIELSKELLQQKATVAFLGENFVKRSTNINEFLKFLKTITDIKIINVNQKSNAEGIAFSAIKNVSQKDLNKNVRSVGVNLDNTLTIGNISEKTNKYAWFNTHGSKLALKYKYIVPTLTSFEQEETHINLEQRPQKTAKVLRSINNTRKLKTVIKYFFGPQKKSTINFEFYYYLKELVFNSKSFISLKTVLIFNLFYKKSNNASLFIKYPIKTSIEDYFLSNRTVKNSLIMTDCSRISRQQHLNFNKCY